MRARWLCVAVLAVWGVSCVPTDVELDERVGPLGDGPGSHLPAGVWRSAATAPASEPATASAPAAGPSATASAPAPLRLTVADAVLQALENHPALKVQRFDPAIRQQQEQVERAAFDPVVAAEVAAGRDKANRPDHPAGPGDLRSKQLSAEAAASLTTPTGTTVEAVGQASILDSSAYTDDLSTARLGLTVTQALLRGASVQANLAKIRQARLDTLGSRYELRAVAEALAADVERSYWNYALALRQIEIVQDALDVADRQLDETRERIRVGALAETEVAASEAEQALRRERLINARSAAESAQLRLQRLLSPGQRPFERELVLQQSPQAPRVSLDPVGQHVQVGLAMRNDLNQARLAVQRGQLELVQTRDGLLPRLELFITLGRSGYADAFGRSVQGLDEDGYDLLAGARFEFPPYNRSARARHQQATLSEQQSREAVQNMAELVELDVRTAYVEVERTRQQIAATAATRRLQQETLRAETEKFGVGKSTSLLVAQAQRDLLGSRIAEVEAVVNYLKALVDLHRLEGSLLARRGIDTPAIENP